VLYALRQPLALLALLLAFVLGIVLRGVVQAHLAARLGGGSALAQGRGSLDPRRHVDPFGAVAAAIAGVGWGAPVERPSYLRKEQRGRILAVLLAGPVVLLLTGAVLIAGFIASAGTGLGLASTGLLPAVLHGSVALEPLPLMLLCAGIELLAMGVLALIPLPPLDGGRILFLYAPRTSGWQKAEYHLAEQNVGTVVLLVLLIIPLAGQNPLLLFLLDVIVHPLLALVGS